MRKQRVSLLNSAVDIQDATDEGEYLEALADSSGHGDLSARWKGIDKAQKQKIWFVKEDLDAEMEKCDGKEGEPECAYLSDLKNLKRAVDTYVKAFEAAESGDVQEFNQLTGVSGELIWKAINNLATDKKVNLSEEEIDGIVTRFISIQFIDDVERMETCNKISSIFHEYARYKGHCGYDFLTTIRAMSNEINDLKSDDNMPNTGAFVTVCTIESQLRNSEALKPPAICPLAAKKLNDIRWANDLYLSQNGTKK